MSRAQTMAGTSLDCPVHSQPRVSSTRTPTAAPPAAAEERRAGHRRDKVPAPAESGEAPLASLAAVLRQMSIHSQGHSAIRLRNHGAPPTLRFEPVAKCRVVHDF